MALDLPSNGSTIIAFSKRQTFPGQRSPGLSVTDSDKTVLASSSRYGDLIAQAVGDNSVTLSTRKVVQIQANVSVPFSLKDWNITIEDWHPTSNPSSTQTEITNHTILNTDLKPCIDHNLPMFPVWVTTPPVSVSHLRTLDSRLVTSSTPSRFPSAVTNSRPSISPMPSSISEFLSEPG